MCTLSFCKYIYVMHTLLLKCMPSAFADLDAEEELLLEVCGWQVRIVFTLSKNNSSLHTLSRLVKQIVISIWVKSFLKKKICYISTSQQKRKSSWGFGGNDPQANFQQQLCETTDQNEYQMIRKTKIKFLQNVKNSQFKKGYNV